MDCILELRNVNKSYKMGSTGLQVLQNVSLKRLSLHGGKSSINTENTALRENLWIIWGLLPG